MSAFTKQICVPFETKPQGWWFDALIEFISYADVVRQTYPGQFTEIPGAVLLTLEARDGLHGKGVCERS